jgi:hypothetical protein
MNIYRNLSYNGAKGKSLIGAKAPRDLKRMGGVGGSRA